MGKGAKVIFYTLTILLIIIVAAGSIYYYKEFYLYKTDYLDEVTMSSLDYEVDIYLVYAIIKVESSFDASAKSSAGALGLMQLIPDTAEYMKGEELAEEELFDPTINIDLGIKYLKYLSEKFNSREWVIVAYNAGETKAREWMNNDISPYQVPFKESREYLVKVNNAMRRYKELYYLY